MTNMFEQPLYEFEPAKAPLKESDLFRDYEIKSWVLSPRLIKIVALSTVVNIIAALVVAQTSLLTMKGCDSPFVGSVCQVLDTVYVGALLFGTDREYVDAAYEKTDLGDSEITYIDVSNIMPPLKYPAGYFQIANPEQAMLNEEFVDPGTNFTHGIPGIPNGMPITPPSSGESLFNTPPIVPKSNPNVVEGELPGYGNTYHGGGTYYSPMPKPRAGRGKRPPLLANNPDDPIPGISDSNTVAEKHSPSASPTPPAVEPTGPVDANAINTRPLKDTLIKVIDLLDKRQLDLQAPIHVVASAKLAKDGKIAKGSFKVTGAEGDKQLAMVVAETLAAFNDSNLLSYLGELSGKDLSFSVEQDPTTVKAAIRSQVESADRAKSIAGLVKLSLGFVIGKKENKIRELETVNDPAKAAELQSLRDDLTLLNSIQPSSNGKEFTVGFISPKPLVQQWIQTRLAEQRAEPKPTDGNAGSKPADNPVKN